MSVTISLHEPLRDYRLPSLRNLLLAAVLIVTIGALPGCASFSSSMTAAPERTGAPPYADDPEANGNPAKAWYN